MHAPLWRQIGTKSANAKMHCALANFDAPRTHTICRAGVSIPFYNFHDLVGDQTTPLALPI